MVVSNVEYYLYVFHDVLVLAKSVDSDIRSVEGNYYKFKD